MPPDLKHEMLLTVVTAISAGIFLIVLARRINMPAIVLLLIGGIGLGPEGLGFAKPDSLGPALSVFVSLAVGLILFEGGLTLDLNGYRSAPVLIRRLLTVGVLTTWLATATAIFIIFHHDVAFSLLAASLVIVTGPTVILPLLRRIKVNDKLHAILHWEAVLIDAIGVFFAILCFEWFTRESGNVAMTNFGVRIGSGLGMGLAGGFFISQAIRWKIVPGDMMNVFALAGAMLVFGLAESIKSEAGVLAVTVAGFVAGLKQLPELKNIRQFKAEITDLLIGMLFILLAARLKFEQFNNFGARGAVLVAIVVFAVRPLNIVVSSWKLGLNWREKAFLAWLGPRGIVAASMASLVAINLQQDPNVKDPRFVETFTYSVIITTVVLQGLTAGPLAYLLKLKRPVPTGWMIVGAHTLGRRVAKFIKTTAGLHVALLDTNPRAIVEAHNEGLCALQLDARDRSIEERLEIAACGNLLALTDNEDLNEVLCQVWGESLAAGHVLRWSSAKRQSTPERHAAGRAVWVGLPKPSLISGELLRGEAELISLAGTSTPYPGAPLAMSDGKKVLVDDPGQTDLSKMRDAIFLSRSAEYLSRSIFPEMVIRVSAAGSAELFAQMLDAAIVKVPSLPREELLAQLIEREKSFSTAIGNGIAVPHAYCKTLPFRLCLIAHAPAGVPFHAPDGEPANLVFLLLSPPGDPEGHLAAMAEIARIAGDEHAREKLRTAPDAPELFDRLRTVLSQYISA